MRKEENCWNSQTLESLSLFFHILQEQAFEKYKHFRAILIAFLLITSFS